MSIQRLSSRLSHSGGSPTAEISVKVRALREAGKDVVNLGEGELDFSTPAHIAEAGISAIRAGQTKYTPIAGTPELKAAIIHKLKNENNLSYQPNEVISGAGAKQIVFNAIFATTNSGDEVIISAPYWTSYPDMIYISGGEPVIVNTTRKNRWIIQPEDLEAAITPKTRWVILNSPNNPSGAVYTKEDLRALADVLLRHPHVLIIADDIYENVVYDGGFETLAAVEPKLLERILTVNGVSKGYSMTGWRVGYAGGPAWIISAMEILQSHSTAHPSSISQAAAVTALQSSKDFVAEWIDILKERRSVAMDFVTRADGVEALAPEGAFYVFADCTALIGKSTPDGKIIENGLDIANYFLDEAHVGVVHGEAFGMPAHIRIAYAVDTPKLRKACDRLVEAVSKLR
jgi:aspartate aminotransferase